MPSCDAASSDDMTIPQVISGHRLCVNRFQYACRSAGILSINLTAYHTSSEPAYPSRATTSASSLRGTMRAFGSRRLARCSALSGPAGGAGARPRAPPPRCRCRWLRTRAHPGPSGPRRACSTRKPARRRRHGRATRPLGTAPWRPQMHRCCRRSAPESEARHTYRWLGMST